MCSVEILIIYSKEYCLFPILTYLTLFRSKYLKFIRMCPALYSPYIGLICHRWPDRRTVLRCCSLSSYLSSDSSSDSPHSGISVPNSLLKTAFLFSRFSSEMSFWFILEE